jgi:tetratricopeptide (TPR) repeat protein
MKVLIYYGGIVGGAMDGRVISEPPDLRGMSQILHGAVQLDPYNMDVYYFAQGFLTWDAKQYKIANELLEYGMKYRTWDWSLPSFVGFNYAYFLKDYTKAAEFYKRAGELSGNQLFNSLAGRYMHEAGQTELALAYLTSREQKELNPILKRSYQIRIQAFSEVRRIENARDCYRQQYGALPPSVESLVQTGLLKPSPVDPYNGRFYIEADGKISSTSKFAFLPTKGE